MERIVEVDERRRLGLGQLGSKEDTRYLAHDNPDGSIVLEPIVIMSAAQARFMANPERTATLTQAIRDARERPEELVDYGDEIDRLTDQLGLDE